MMLSLISWLVLGKIVFLALLLVTVVFGAAGREWRKMNKRHLAIGLAVIVAVNLASPLLGLPEVTHTYPLVSLLMFLPLAALYLFAKARPSKASAPGRSPFDLPLGRLVGLYFVVLVSI